LDGIDFMPWDDRGRSNGWLSVITLAPGLGVTTTELCAALEEGDIEARPAWKPMHLQPVFGGVPCIGGATAEDLFARGVCLPSGSGMSDEDVDRVVDAVSSVVARARS
jgi:pyridoxal phosphate-dependent aminotransferase EpsN